MEHRGIKQLIIYTFDLLSEAPQTRWNRPGLPFELFNSLEEARNALFTIRKNVQATDDETWQPVQIEKIEVEPIVGPKFWTLLREGLGPFVRSCAIVETVE